MFRYPRFPSVTWGYSGLVLFEDSAKPTARARLARSDGSCFAQSEYDDPSSRIRETPPGDLSGNQTASLATQ
jgi:hypothetical protein